MNIKSHGSLIRALGLTALIIYGVGDILGAGIYAVLSSLGIAGLLYLSVSWMATAIIPGSELGQSNAPLLDVVSKS